MVGGVCMEDNKEERVCICVGGDKPSVFPAQHGLLGVGSPVPSLSHCGSALSSAAVASTW